jgi:glycosyltransferase involved in cell wall biosynthesis
LVVVPTHNRARLLPAVLRAIERTRRAFDGTAEVVLVDDGSTDATPAILAEAVRHGTLDRVLRNPRARGPAAARNLGWKCARARIVAFTDDDCEVEAGWLSELVATLDAAPPAIAGVGGRVTAARPGLVADYMTFHRILQPPESLSYLVTANAAFRREALEAVGGFDESVTAPGGEDPGLCQQLRSLGYGFAFQERAHVAHHYREGLRAFARTFYRYGRGCHLVLDP